MHLFLRLHPPLWCHLPTTIPLQLPHQVFFFSCITMNKFEHMWRRVRCCFFPELHQLKLLKSNRASSSSGVCDVKSFLKFVLSGLNCSIQLCASRSSCATSPRRKCPCSPTRSGSPGREGLRELWSARWPRWWMRRWWWKTPLTPSRSRLGMLQVWNHSFW